MKLTKLKTLSVLVLFLGFIVTSCTDLSVDNLNDPGRDDALSSPSDLVSLLSGQTTNQFFAEHGYSGVHMDGLADQMSTTNNVNRMWDFAKEPRITINNRTSYSYTFALEQDWDESNSSISTANTIIDRVENGDPIVLEDGTDISQKMLAAAYFLRGIARGSLGMTYDQAYLVDEEADPAETPEFKPYPELIDAAVSDMDEAIKTAESIGQEDFVWDFLQDGTDAELDLAEFKTVANSFSARFLANTPRTNSEAQDWDWERVIEYAEKGIGGENAAANMTDWSATSIANEFYSNWQDWEATVYPPPAGYIPTDIKVIHMLDPSYPTSYPSTEDEDGSSIPDLLEPEDVNTDDPRIDYFNYSESFGYLDPSRSIDLHSNYWNLRLYTENSGYATSGYPVIFFVEAELDYIRAEAYLMEGQKGNAADELNDSPFGSGQTDVSPDMPAVQLGNLSQDGFSGGNDISSTASDEEFVRALHKEYSVELALIDRKGLQWFFMRKHNLLQEGTALHYPVPGSELEITQRDYYTFGGVDNAGNEGTADGSNSWMNNSGSKQNTESVSSDKQYNAKQLPIEEFENLGTGGKSLENN